MRYVNKAVPKTDGMALTSGKGLYTDDLAPRDCLVVKILRSPHAFARIKSIREDSASRVAGIGCILTWEDVPQIRYTLAGQSYPEPSPYDRYILERTVRYVGDPVAIVAGRDKDCVAKAMGMIQVKYDILEPVLDFETALDNPVVVHPEEDYFHHFDIGGDPKRNLVSSGCDADGGVGAAVAACDGWGAGTYYPNGQRPGHDGDLPHLHLSGPQPAAQRGVLHSGTLPLPPHHCPCPGPAQKHGAGGAAPDRRGPRRQADPGQ